jgi:hypothetical protein
MIPISDIRCYIFVLQDFIENMRCSVYGKLACEPYCETFLENATHPLTLKTSFVEFDRLGAL